MLLVDAMESRLGSVETWPTSILTIIFAFDPHMQNAISKLETVIAFFFGNCVPLQMACQLFSACSGHPLVLVEDQFHSLYEFWSRPCGNKYCYYYNMWEGRYKYIDGSDVYSFSSITPKTGFKGTGFPTIIRSILRSVCQMELKEESD